jgi:hypothetical protein
MSRLATSFLQGVINAMFGTKEKTQGGVPRAFRKADERIGISARSETGIARSTLLAKTQASDRCAIALDVLSGQIGEQTTPLADQLEEASAGVVVVLVRAQMIGEPVDALGQQCDLYLWGTRVTDVGLELRNDRILLLAL